MQLARITQGLVRAIDAKKGAVTILVMSIVGLNGCSALKQSEVENNKKIDLVVFDVNSKQRDDLAFCELGSSGNWACPSVTKKTPVSFAVVEQIEDRAVIEEAKPKHLDNILFDFNKSILTDAAKAKLIAYLPLLAGNRVVLSGYTDDVGTGDYNKNLGQERANSVKNFLIQMGISLNLLESNGLGECCFVMPNDNDKSRSLNRRVEIYIEEQSRRK